ncbi:hypothetical protein NX801_00745 [Streptomyces sp. LP05-1]|uniref:Serine/arginine repetitive matrix protein 2 n=1 Tax=Streptomyces pyxinae TaxID=2970734 RepID=A0ABT2CA74_9ACTN|nr:hypothetical protein [Streptomyces sp. LP05-1]MCS0634215.1 hypothetical protein [Streptomyces sp. LP05-1]
MAAHWDARRQSWVADDEDPAGSGGSPEAGYALYAEDTAYAAYAGAGEDGPVGAAAPVARPGLPGPDAPATGARPGTGPVWDGTAWSGAARPGAPAGRRRPVLIAVLVAGVLAAGAVGVRLGSRDTGPGPATPGTASRSGSPASSASASDSGWPPGTRLVRDEAGFTVALPDGWQREPFDTGATYRSPDRTAVLTVRPLSGLSVTPQELVQQTDPQLRASLGGYVRIRLDGTPGTSGAGELVYEYDETLPRQRTRVLERVFTSGDGGVWVIFTAGPASDPSAVEARHQAAVAGFRPTA